MPFFLLYICDVSNQQRLETMPSMIHPEEDCPFKKQNAELEKRLEIQDKIIAELRERVTKLQEKEKSSTNMIPTEGVYNLLHKIKRGEISPNKAYGELFGTLDVYCQCEELSNINDSITGIDVCVKCDKVIQRI